MGVGLVGLVGGWLERERERKRDKFLAAAAPTPVENGVAVGVALQKEMERGWRDGEKERGLGWQWISSRSPDAVMIARVSLCPRGKRRWSSTIGSQSRCSNKEAIKSARLRLRVSVSGPFRCVYECRY